MATSLTEEARKKANLKLLQRSVDPSFTDIIGSATHVVLYEFIAEKGGWDKSHVEGSLFLVVSSSSSSQQYTLVILNRNSTENFIVEITPTFQLQHKDPYIIFKQQPKIRGVWFHSADERVVVASLLDQVLQELQRRPPPPLLMPTGMTTTTPESATGVVEPLLNSLLISQEQQQEKAPLSEQQPTATTTTATTAAAAAPSESPIVPPAGVALDKKSLQLALLSLIQDERFIDLLHAQYLKVAHVRANRSSPKK